MADVEMIYEHSRACAVHAEASREHGPVVWCVNRAEHLGPGMYAAQPYPRAGGCRTCWSVSACRHSTRCCRPGSSARHPAPIRVSRSSGGTSREAIPALDWDGTAVAECGGGEVRGGGGGVFC